MGGANFCSGSPAGVMASVCVCVGGGWGDGTLKGGVTLEWGGGELATMLFLANNLT